MATPGGHELTRQERAVLAAVGRRLTNAEIAAELVVSVRTVESHIAALRRKLDAGTRAALVTAAQARPAGGLPLPHNSFVGRAPDLAAVRGLLRTHGQVTLVGPAGVGKSRLALETAAAGARVAVVVELEHATPQDTVDAVAKAIGLTGVTGADLVGACAVALSGAPYLLVLDNVDRVCRASVQLARLLRAAVRGLEVLLTARTATGATDEVLHAVTPLSTRPQDDDGAVRLFWDRAAGHAPTAELARADTQVVSAICRRLDGLPLAIELAAVRTRHLTLAELAQRLDRGLGALDRTGPPHRHRTLEAAFAWTWDLLTPDERATVQRLAALPRTFDLDLADTVAPPRGADVVLRLLDQSLVLPVRGAEGAVRRFRMLRPLRDFLLARTPAEVVLEVREVHARCHVEIADRLRRQARTSDDSRLAAQARRVCAELNAAADWALAHERVGLALPLVRALSVGGEQFSPDPGSLGTITRAARDPRVRELADAAALAEIGQLLCYGDLDLVDELAGCAASKATDDRSALAAHHLAGWAAAYRGQEVLALQHLDRAERLALALDDTWQLASVRQGRGVALGGRPQEAIAAFAAASQTYAAAGDAMHLNNARYMMAATAADLGRRDPEAVGWAQQCAAYARRTGNRHELAHARLTLARLSDAPGTDELEATVETFRIVGDLRCLHRSQLLLATQLGPAERLVLLREALDVARQAHDRANERVSLDRLAQAQRAVGDEEGAAVTEAARRAVPGPDRVSLPRPGRVADPT